MGSSDDFETYYSLLYTIPSFPNIILPFFGGYFVDTLGAYKCMVVFISVIAVGQVVFAFGLSIKSWPVMVRHMPPHAITTCHHIYIARCRHVAAQLPPKSSSPSISRPCHQTDVIVALCDYM